MQLNTDSGWLTTVQHCLSPNFNARPAHQSINLLVIHNISLPPGEFGTPYIEQLFTNQLNADDHSYFQDIAKLTVSAHCLIKRTGEVVQFVSFQDRAWHAGVSCFDGQHDCNNFAIGIELEGTDDIPYTDQQYEQLILITRLIMQTYPEITSARITGHSDIAPGRKTDPGPAFDWERYKNAL